MHGYKNYETWNVALWIQNDEGLYEIAKTCDNYRQFAQVVRTDDRKTPDGVSWLSPKLSKDELDEVVKECRD